MTAPPCKPTVFISYSHDSAEHSARVLQLSDTLRAMGVDAELDRYHVRPEQGWPMWCEERLQPQNARFVLVVCTQSYRDRVEKKVRADEGRGVFWEGAILYQYLYDAKGNARFVPILLGDEPETSIPVPLRGQTRYRIKAFDLGDANFEALYRELTGQLAVVKPPLGSVVSLGPTKGQPTALPPLPERPALTSFAPPSSTFDIDRIDKYAPDELIGREDETKLIDDAWAKAVAGEAHPKALTFVALGGEGKTALLAKWAIALAAKDWPGCEAALAWSFYSQGTREIAGASADAFLAEALRFFGASAIAGESAHDKGKRLANIIGATRALLILDGVEPLQYPPTSPMAGELKDPGLLALLKGLAQRNAGLCLVTTRYKIKDLEAWREAAPQKDLAPLTKEAGARLLAALGVKGTLAERERLAADVKGHALTLNLIGSYLRDAHGGDIRRRDEIRLEEADAEEFGGHAFRAMDAYVRWFESDGEKGCRALAMLRLMGLFDRPADAGCLGALWKPPAIEGLTEPLVGLDGPARNVVLKRLADAKLITVARDLGGALVAIDAHPLLREYFAKRLREARPKSWKAAHRRLYEHLCATTPDKEAPTLDDLQPLYQAVAHGCWAGLHEEARAKVYRDRILRGTGPDGFYSRKKLGAIGASLSAVACFFDPPWRRVSPDLQPAAKAWLLGEASFCLRTLGRLAEAREPLRGGLEMEIGQERWRNSAIGASNLSELELTLGEIGAANRDSEAAVAHADRSGDAFLRVVMRAIRSDALHQAGRRAEAEALFAAAEAMQAEWQPECPRLYSLQGFQYCDLLLADAERAAWRRSLGLAVGADDSDAPASPIAPGALRTARNEQAQALEASADACRAVSERATQTLAWVTPQNWLLDIGLDHLTLARAALFAAILRGEPPPPAHVNKAVDFLRRAGEQDELPRGLLTRALWRAASGDFSCAREDLDEAFEIAERGPMRLFLADIHLSRARLLGLLRNRPPVILGSPPATTSTARRSSSMAAATAAGARNSPTPKPPSAASARDEASGDRAPVRRPLIRRPSAATFSRKREKGSIVPTAPASPLASGG
jgi:hypothetical protein